MYYHWIIPQPLLQNSRSAPVELTVRFADDMGTGASSTKRNNIGGQRPIFRRSLHEGGLHGQGRRRGFQFQRHCQTGWKCSQGSFSLYCSKYNITILYFITKTCKFFKWDQVQSECAWLLLLVFMQSHVQSYNFLLYCVLYKINIIRNVHELSTCTCKSMTDSLTCILLNSAWILNWSRLSKSLDFRQQVGDKIRFDEGFS